MKITFVPKYEAAEGAGEEKEYAQIWERNISVARRCLGKGAAEDRLVLNTAVWRALNARKVEEELPMEVEKPMTDLDSF